MNTKEIGGALEVDTDAKFLRHLFVYHPALYRSDKTLMEKRDWHADHHADYGKKH